MSDTVALKIRRSWRAYLFHRRPETCLRGNVYTFVHTVIIKTLKMIAVQYSPKRTAACPDLFLKHAGLL